MKIAIQSMDREHVGENFGRTRFFAVYDTETEETVFLSNEENRQAAHGVGIQSAALMAREKVSWVISYHVGPKAKEILEQSGVRIYTLSQDDVPLKIEEAVRMFLEQEH